MTNGRNLLGSRAELETRQSGTAVGQTLGLATEEGMGQMIKIGFSSLACPGWDLETIVTNAASMGFDGVELRGVRGELQLPVVPELARSAEHTRALFRDNNVELVCLASSSSLDSKNTRELARNTSSLVEFIELAESLGCPYVRFFIGEVGRRDHRRAALGRIAAALTSVVPIAQRHGVTLLIENGGDFPGSEDLWFLVDSVGHPALRCCWNQCHALTGGERPTISMPRLGNKIGLVHVCDAAFDDQGVLLEYRTIGEGDAEIATQINLLRGMVYNRYIVFEWPKLWDNSLEAPETVLPGAVKFLRERVEEKQAVLSAYKGDKCAPSFASPGEVSS